MPTDPKPVPTKMTSADPRGTRSLERAFKKPVEKEKEPKEEDEHAEFSSDKDSEHKKYMKSDSAPSY